MPIENSYNFRSVDDRLTTSGVIGAGRLHGLAGEGYELVINLLPDSSEYAVRDEASIVTDQGVEYCYIPVDFQAPQASDYAAFAEALDAAGQRKVHIHCAANYRVSAFYSLYAMQRGLWSELQARVFVTDLWEPAEYPVWQRFIEQMRALQE